MGGGDGERPKNVNYITDKNGQEIDARNPLPVRDMGVAWEREAVTAEAITLIAGGAATMGVVAVDKAPVVNLAGDRVGSFWRNRKNLRLLSGVRPDGSRSTLDSVTEGAGTAAVTITDTYYNLEALFEGPAGVTRRAVLVIRDASGDELQGWIGAITVAGSVYTLNLFNTRLSTLGGDAQSWIGTLANFTYAAGATYEIYSYESSFSVATGDAITTEVEYREDTTEEEQLRGMANGEYAVDYQRGRILFRKATATTAHTVDYSVRKSYITADLEASDIEIGAVELKDAATDTRAEINAANTARTTATNVVVVQVVDEDGVVVGGSPGPEAPQAQGTDAVGADAYVTVVTASARRTHILCSLGGVNAAIVSLDSGVTDHIYVPANSVMVLDDVVIASGATVQARNAVAGSNYADLFITNW